MQITRGGVIKSDFFWHSASNSKEPYPYLSYQDHASKEVLELSRAEGAAEKKSGLHRRNVSRNVRFRLVSH